MHFELLLPCMIYKRHKYYIIALVYTYGGWEVLDVESCRCPGVSCCPLCCSRPRAIEGNTRAIFHMMPALEWGCGGHQDTSGCLANGTLRCLGLCHSVPARCIQSCSTAIDLRLASSTPAAMAQATGAVRVLRYASHHLPPPAPTHTYTHIHRVLSCCPCSWPDLDLPLENQVAHCSCSWGHRK